MPTIQTTTIPVQYARGPKADLNALSIEDLRGLIFYCTDEHAIYVDSTLEPGEEPVMQRMSGDVKNVTWNNSTKQLTITPFTGSPITISLSTDSLATALASLQQRVQALEDAEIKVSGNLVTQDTSDEKGKLINLSAKYWSESKKIRFYASATAPTTDDNTHIFELDASSFIKDGMVRDVSFNAGTRILTITFNTDAGSEPVDVDLSALVDVYKADGLGLKLTGNTFSLNLATSGLLKKSASGLEIDKYALLSYLATKVDAIIASEEYSADGIESDINEGGSDVDVPIINIQPSTAGTEPGQISINKAALIAAIQLDSNVTLEGITVSPKVGADSEIHVTVDVRPRWKEVVSGS